MAILELFLGSKESPVPGMEGIPELVTNDIELRSEEVSSWRLNLVVPSLDFKNSYGGITTAIRLMSRLSPEFGAIRIIATHQTQAEIDFSGWPEWSDDSDMLAPRSIVGIGDRSRPVSVIARDVFLATAWTTAIFARRVIKRQVQRFSEAVRHFVYFIQDYETGFYPWSVQSHYVESTYRNAYDTIAVFNSARLANFFRKAGALFSSEYVFEPLIHPDLRAIRLETIDRPKERLIYVYARVGLPRNGFDLIIDSLRIWAREFPHAQNWSVVSFGTQHANITLGPSVVLQSMGKGSMYRYGDYLSRCWVGLSFQFMAHPSYSRLEMAEFGAWVITNKIENNDLSDIAPNIVSVDEPSPEAVAESLSWCCSQYKAGMSAVLPDLPKIFEDREDEFPSASELVKSWCHSRHAR